MSGWTFAYLGPETILPLASALAAVGGAILAFGRRPVLWVRSAYRMLFKKKGSDIVEASSEES
jgi:hypothetical protein